MTLEEFQAHAWNISYFSELHRAINLDYEIVQKREEDRLNLIGQRR